ncbi:MAG: DeoR/GlpR family DNA-binding transcription regulator [Clostridiales bacterium]|nr:DeoR/GlpR family DNA-binding transcription regulator [Clostridiales bacterium]
MASRDTNLIFVEERQSQILQMLSQEQKLLVDDLCKQFGVSATTIRNDLHDLSERGLLQRTHGGAVSVSKVNFEQSTDKKVISYLPEKNRIAQAASDMIEDGDTVVLDTGSTTYVLANAIKARNLTIVTNDLSIALLLEKKKDYRIVLLGGAIRNEYHCTLGSTTVDEMRRLHVDKTFIATNSVSIRDGLSTPDLHQADIKRQMIASADRTILLATSNKFGRNSFVKFADITDIKHIITDDGINSNDIQALKAMRIGMTIV